MASAISALWEIIFSASKMFLAAETQTTTTWSLVLILPPYLVAYCYESSLCYATSASRAMGYAVNDWLTFLEAAGTHAGTSWHPRLSASAIVIGHSSGLNVSAQINQPNFLFG